MDLTTRQISEMLSEMLSDMGQLETSRNQLGVEPLLEKFESQQRELLIRSQELNLEQVEANIQHGTNTHPKEVGYSKIPTGPDYITSRHIFDHHPFSHTYGPSLPGSLQPWALCLALANLGLA